MGSLMNSADVFLHEFEMLTRTLTFGRILDRFRKVPTDPNTHRQLLLELQHVINVHSRLCEVAADVVPPEDRSAWQDLLSVPALGFDQGGSFLEDLRSLGIHSLDRVSLTPLPQTIALAAYAHYQLMERATVGLVGYLWFFERMPRLFYPLWIESARRGGVPEKALTALLGAGALHDELRDQHVARCCSHTQTLRDTAELFASMVDAALQRVEFRYGIDSESADITGGGIGQVA
jgi:hypothetical protein